jgi:hypothetical protein
MASNKEGLTPIAGRGSKVKARPDFPHKGCGGRGAKKARHQRKGSSTPGNTKPTCKTTWQARWACRGARAYKHPDYPIIMRKLYKKAGNHKAMMAFTNEPS